MEKSTEKKINPPVLPQGKFADRDETYCCEYCDYNIDEKENFFSHKVLCGIDGKWHKASDVCRNYK